MPYPNQKQALAMDEVSILKRQLEDERKEAKQREDKLRSEVDQIRKEHSKNMEELDIKQTLKRKLYEQEKEKLV